MQRRSKASRNTSRGSSQFTYFIVQPLLIV